MGYDMGYDSYTAHPTRESGQGCAVDCASGKCASEDYASGDGVLGSTSNRGGGGSRRHPMVVNTAEVYPEANLASVGGKGKVKGGKGGKGGKGNNEKINSNVCFNFLNGSCKNGDEGSRMHQKVRIPASFCPDFAKRNDVCSGEQQCGLTHGTWPVIIEAINSGTVPKHPHTVAVMEETHSTRGRDRSECGGNGKGGKGGRSHSGHGDTSVGRGRGKGKDGGSGKRLRSKTPGSGANSGPICTRCKTLVIPTANATPLSMWMATPSPPRSKPRSRKELGTAAGAVAAAKRMLPSGMSPSDMKTPEKTMDSFTKVLFPTGGKPTWHPERSPSRRRGPSTPLL